MLLISWAMVGILYFTFIIKKYEARYLIPIFPPFYILAVTALARCKVKLAQMALTSGLFLWVFYFGVVEVFRYHDPIFYSGFHQRVSLEADKAAGSRRVIWVGPMYPINPENFVFNALDPYTNLYHFHINAVRFFANRDMSEASALNVWLDDVRRSARLQNILLEGDLLIVNHEPDLYRTSSLPTAIGSLELMRVVSGLSDDSALRLESLQSFHPRVFGNYSTQ